MSFRAALSVIGVALLIGHGATGCRTVKSWGHAMGTGLSTAGRSTVNATAAAGRAIGTGARKLAGGAAKLWPWRGEQAAPASAPDGPATPVADKPEPPLSVPAFPTRGFLVADAEFGAESTQLEATAVSLPGGWEVQGNVTRYSLDADGLSPRILKATGSPATAISSSGDSVSAREIHYRHRTGVLVLKGSPTVKSGTSTMHTSESAIIKIHLPSGATAIDGPMSWRDG